MSTFVKDPRYEGPYGVDMSDCLAAGVTVANVEVSVIPAGLSATGEGVLDGTKVYAVIAGGVLGKTYEVTFIAILSSGERVPSTIRISIDTAYAVPVT